MSASAGRVLLIPKGEYNSQTTYQPLDMIYYNGNSYVCKLTSTGNLPTNTTYFQKMTEAPQAADMTGATSSAAGAHGLVPAPAAGDQDKVLKGDGTWGVNGSTVSVSHIGTASSSGVRKQQITVDNVAYDIDGTAYMEQTINTSTSATSSATFSNAAITANSVIDVYTSQLGLCYSNITVSEGSCVVTFPAQASAASVTVRIYIR